MDKLIKRKKLMKQSHETKNAGAWGGWMGWGVLNASVVLEDREHHDLSNLPLVWRDSTSLGSTKVRRHLLDIYRFLCGGGAREREEALLHTCTGRGPQGEKEEAENLT